MSKEIKTIGVLTSGGDSPGMNAAVRAVTRAALNKGLKVMGIRRGYKGLLNRDIFEMGAKDVSSIIQQGGTILYSARCPEFRELEYQKKGADICREFGIEGLVVIGGDGSFMGAQKLADQGINTIGVPGTIDLDIACTEYTIGFDTAVNVALDAICKLRDTSRSHERCCVVEVMGRNAGYIASWCGVACGADTIVVAENGGLDKQKVIERVQHNRDKGKDHNIVIVAEGVMLDFKDKAQKENKVAYTSHDLAKDIEEATGIESRATILGHIQRGGTPTALDIKHASMMGAFAVELLLEGKSQRVVAYKDGEYVDYGIYEALDMKKDGDTELLETNELISKY